MNRLLRTALLAAPLLAAAACGDPPAPRPAGEIVRGAPIAGAPAAPSPGTAEVRVVAPPRPGPALPPLGDESDVGDVTPPSESQRIDETPVVPLVPPAAGAVGADAAKPPEPVAGGDGAAKPPDAPAEGVDPADGEKPAEKPAGEAAVKEGAAPKEAKAAEGASAATARSLNFEFLASFEYLPPDPDVAGSDVKSLASIPEDVKKLDGTWATVEGYMLPLEYADDGVKAFLVSRHQMGCCFGVLPKPNELVEVEMPEGKIAPYVSYIPVLVTGKLRVGPKEGASTVLSGIYRLEEPAVDIREEDDETR